MTEPVEQKCPACHRPWFEHISHTSDPLLQNCPVEQKAAVRDLLGCLYQFVGAHALEDDELRPWLDALSAASEGSAFTCDGLLPYTLPQDRPRTNHDHQHCQCYGCILERIATLEQRVQELEGQLKDEALSFKPRQ